MTTVKQQTLNHFNYFIAPENANSPLDQFLSDPLMWGSLDQIHKILKKHVDSDRIFEFIFSVELPERNCNNICFAPHTSNSTSEEWTLNCDEQYKSLALKSIEKTFDHYFGQLGHYYYSE